MTNAAWKLSTLLMVLLVCAASSRAAERPNIIFILVDDLCWDDLGCTGHPFVRTPHIDRIAHEGVLFKNAFVTTPLCSPSRASFLTGQYAHTHGIIDNTDRSAASHKLVTFPWLLHDAGYETGYIGKWHMGNDDSPRRGFDHWVALKGQGSSNDPELNENGKSRQVKGYTTDILNERAVSFVERTRAKPFFLYVAHKALHPETVQRADGSLSDPSASNFIPAERHKQLYADEKIVRRPNALAPPKGKPALERRIPDVPPLGPATGTSDETIRDRLRMLAAVDEGVGQLLASLEKTKRLDNTFIVLAGDNGYFYGEHGLSVERRLAYEESIRIPLIARYPALIKPSSTIEEMVLNIDLAPTLTDLARVFPRPQSFDGESWLPLLNEKRDHWRKEVLIEYFSDKVFPRTAGLGYNAIRTNRWKLIHYTEQKRMDELYDLKADPYELNNVIDDVNLQVPLKDLRRNLQYMAPNPLAEQMGDARYNVLYYLTFVVPAVIMMAAVRVRSKWSWRGIVALSMLATAITSAASNDLKWRIRRELAASTPNYDGPIPHSAANMVFAPIFGSIEGITYTGFFALLFTPWRHRVLSNQQGTPSDRNK